MELDDPDWLIVLRVFYEENLSFEYDPNPASLSSFMPERAILNGVDIVEEIRRLKRAGLLEVSKVHVSDPSVPFDEMNVLQLSEKGVRTVHDWERKKHQFQIENKRLKEQQRHESARTIQSQQVNAAVGYLTLGLLLVGLLELLLTGLQTLGAGTYGIFSVLVVGLLAVGFLAWNVISSGLLSPDEPGELDLE